MKIEIEIGNNLKQAIDGVIANADKGGVDSGKQIKRAFGIDFSSLLVSVIAAKKDPLKE